STGGSDGTMPSSQEASGVMKAGVELISLIRRLASDAFGVVEEPGADLPLMQAGMTSHSATLLRSLISQELPQLRARGVTGLAKLPPTLALDQPTVRDIAEYIM
ncbi:unnamed protein product, partial [Polarella glacialis]